jgi:hypothetical protein
MYKADNALQKATAVNQEAQHALVLHQQSAVELQHIQE